MPRPATNDSRTRLLWPIPNTEGRQHMPETPQIPTVSRLPDLTEANGSERLVAADDQDTAKARPAGNRSWDAQRGLVTPTGIAGCYSRRRIAEIKAPAVTASALCSQQSQTRRRLDVPLLDANLVVPRRWRRALRRFQFRGVHQATSPDQAPGYPFLREMPPPRA